MRFKLAVLLAMASPALGQGAGPTLTIDAYVGGVVTAGTDAEAGTAPFAQVRTVTRLTKAANSPKLVARLELTAAPGSDFKLSSLESVKALDFEAGLALGRQQWNFSLYFGAGVSGRVLEHGDEPALASRRVLAGILVSNSPGSRLTLAVAWDERVGTFAVAIDGAVTVGNGAALIGSILVARQVTTLKLAACVAWGR